jgi:steroid delta-isomerase-like uncharacterized protein
MRSASDVMKLYLLEVVAHGNYGLLDEIAAEDMIDRTAVEGGMGPGRQGLRKHVQYFRSVLPDVEVTIERLIASETEVVGVWRCRGTHTQPIFGVPATGKKLEWSNASIFCVRDGQITHYEGVWGALEAVGRMGAKIVPPNA